MFFSCSDLTSGRHLHIFDVSFKLPSWLHSSPTRPLVSDRWSWIVGTVRQGLKVHEAGSLTVIASILASLAQERYLGAHRIER